MGAGVRAELNYLRVYANQLRRKLEPDPAAPVHLLTEPGIVPPAPLSAHRAIT